MIVVVSDVLEYYISKKMVLILGSIFFVRHLTQQRKFYAALFSKLGKFRKATL